MQAQSMSMQLRSPKYTHSSSDWKENVIYGY